MGCRRRRLANATLRRASNGRAGQWRTARRTARSSASTRPSPAPRRVQKKKPPGSSLATPQVIVRCSNIESEPEWVSGPDSGLYELKTSPSQRPALADERTGGASSSKEAHSDEPNHPCRQPGNLPRGRGTRHRCGRRHAHRGPMRRSRPPLQRHRHLARRHSSLLLQHATGPQRRHRPRPGGRHSHHLHRRKQFGGPRRARPRPGWRSLPQCCRPRPAGVHPSRRRRTALLPALQRHFHPGPGRGRRARSRPPHPQGDPDRRAHRPGLQEQAHRQPAQHQGAGHQELPAQHLRQDRRQRPPGARALHHPPPRSGRGRRQRQ